MVGIKAILDALQVRNVPLFLSVPYHDTRCVGRDRVGTNVRHTHSNKRMAFLLPSHSCSDARRSCWRRSRRPTTRHLGISSAPAPPPCGATGAIACQQTVPTTQVVASAPPGVQRAWLPPGCRWRLSITTRFLLGSFSTTTAQATSGRCSLRISRGQTPPQAHPRTVGTRAALSLSELRWRHHTVASHRCENRISFAMPFCIQTDHDSPRQARDKHGKTQKEMRFLQAWERNRADSSVEFEFVVANGTQATIVLPVAVPRSNLSLVDQATGALVFASTPGAGAAERHPRDPRSLPRVDSSSSLAAFANGSLTVVGSYVAISFDGVPPGHHKLTLRGASPAVPACASAGKLRCPSGMTVLSVEQAAFGRITPPPEGRQQLSFVSQNSSFVSTLLKIMSCSKCRSAFIKMYLPDDCSRQPFED
jgi:hypothetical protein